MYQSDSFFIDTPNTKHKFAPTITSAYQILSDKSYYHICDENEKERHPADTIAFIRCTHGKGKVYYSDKEITLNENDYIFFRFKDIIKYKSTTQIWGYRWVNFSAEEISDFELNKKYTSPLTDNEAEIFSRLLFAGQEIKNTNYINSLFTSYLFSIIIENEITGKSQESKERKGLIDDICSYIQQKLYSRISITEISIFFKISPRRIHQIFTSELSISPKQYIIKKKMEEGYRLLVQTSAPINKIAEMLCFSSPYHFSNEFKKIFKQTPTEVRNMEAN